MIYAEKRGGALTGKVREFTEIPDPNPTKGIVWLPYEEAPDPAFDPATQRLSAPETVEVGGKVVKRKRVEALTAEERLKRVYDNREAAYPKAVAVVKGVPSVDKFEAIGFVLDAMIQFYVTVRTADPRLAVPELDDYVTRFTKIKTDNPKL